MQQLYKYKSHYDVHFFLFAVTLYIHTYIHTINSLVLGCPRGLMIKAQDCGIIVSDFDLLWRSRHAGHCWRSKDKLISDVLLWTPAYGQAKAGRPARTYIQQLCEDMWCSLEDLPEAMNDREKWRERARDIRASGTTWWWWWWWWWWLNNVHFRTNTLGNVWTPYTRN